MIGTGFGVDFFSGDVIEYAQTVGSVAKTVGILTFRVFINFRVAFAILTDIGKPICLRGVRPLVWG